MHVEERHGKEHELIFKYLKMWWRARGKVNSFLGSLELIKPREIRKKKQ